MAAAEAYARGELVSEEANRARCGEHAQVVERLRVYEALDRLVERNTRGEEDRQDDEEAGQFLAPIGAKPKRDAKWHGGERIAEVMDHVGQERDRPRGDEDRRLDGGGQTEPGGGDGDGGDAGTGEWP